MENRPHTVVLNAKFGLAVALTLLMIIAPLSSMTGSTGLEFVGDASATGATNPTNQTNQTNPVATNCVVSYASQNQPSTSVQMNANGDYMIQAAPDYYLVDMSCSTTSGNTVFLLLTHQGVSLYQNLTVSRITMGVNATAGQGRTQIVTYYWHDGAGMGVGNIVIVPLLNPIDTTPRISMWPGKVNQHNWNGVWMTDPDGVSGGHPSTMYSNDYGDRKVEYCQKWWPTTNAVQLMPLRETITFYTAGNAVAYDSTKDVYECLMPSGNSSNGSGNGSQGGTTPPGSPPPSGGNQSGSSGNNTNGSQGGTIPPVSPPPSSGNQSGSGSNNTGNGSQGGTTPPSTNPTPPPTDDETDNGGQEGTTPPIPTPPIDNQSSGVSSQIDSQAGESWSPEQQMVVLLISLMIISVLIGIMWSLFSKDQYL